MADDLDPVVFGISVEIQQAIDAIFQVRDEIQQMAASVAESVGEVQASAAEMTAAYTEMADKIEADGARVQESNHKSGVSFKEMAEAAGLFAAYDFLKDSVKVAADGAQANAVLEQSIKNTGAAYNEDMRKSIESVDEQMRKFGYTNEQTNVGLSRMVQMTHNAAEAQNLMGLAANVAAARHMQLDAAVRMVGMAATGHVAMLGRLGIATKDAAGHTLTAKAAIDQLSNTFKGAASAAAGTAAGQFKSFSAELDDAKEKIGNALIPVLQQLLPILLSLVNDLAALLVPILKVAAGFIEHFSGVLKILIPVIIAVLVINKVTEGVKLLGEAIKANPIGALVAILIVLATWLIHVWNTSQTFRDGLAEAFHIVMKIAGDVVYAIIIALKTLADAFLHTLKAMIDGINKMDFTGATDGARKAVDNFVDSADAKMQSWANNAKAWGNNVKLQVGEVAKAHQDAAATIASGTNISSGFSNMVTNGPDFAAQRAAARAAAQAQKAAARAAKQAWDEHHRMLAEEHRKELAAEKAHQAELLREKRLAAEQQKKDLAKQIADLRAQLAAARAALKADANADTQIVNGQLANVGTSVLNLGYAMQPPAPTSSRPIVVNVAGSVVTQQQLVNGIQAGLLATQRTNASVGIKGR